VDDECKKRTCDAGVCGFSFTAKDTPTSTQVPGNCKANVCDGAGNVVSVNDNNDKPVDGNQCTDDVCTNGVPSNPNLSANTACNQNGGAVCNGSGACVQCNTASQCPGVDDECKKKTCDAGVCGFSFTAKDTPTSTQVPGNCKANVCDGAGNVVSINDDSDKPVDGNQCTDDVCTNGVPSNPNSTIGTGCDQKEGNACDGAGACIPTFVLARVGEGGSALTSAATATFLEEYTLEGKPFPGVGSNIVKLPATGTDRLTLSGTATSEGGLSRALDGRSVILAGYDAEAGTASVGSTASTAVKRAVALLDRAHNVDTKTKFDTAFSGNNVRGACTTDGKQIWASGNGSGGTGGIWTTTLGATDAGVQVLSNPGNVRFCHVFLDQLYATSGSGTFVNVFTVGSGTPTTAGQTAISLAGLPTSQASPYSFVIFDTDGDTKPDLLYIADDRVNGNGGIYKWVSADGGATWTAGTPALISLGNTVGVRGLAGILQGKVVTLVVTDTTAGANLAIRVVDDLSTGTQTLNKLVEAATQTVLRGVAMGPR
jgi:hypothetical protein